MNLFVSKGFILASANMEPRLFDLDFQLLSDSILTLLAVLALFFMLSYLLFNPAREFLKKRQDKIKDELEDAKTNQDQALALKQEYELKLREINKEAEAILSDTRKKAMDNEASIIAQAKEEAIRIIARANTEAELEKKKLTDDIKKEMISVASVMAQKVIRTAMNESIQDNLVTDTLKEIGDGTWLS